MSDESKGAGDGLVGKARRLADDALKYARSDEAKAKLDGAKRKAVEVGGAASAGTKGMLSKASQVAAQAKERAEDFSKSEKAQQIRSGARGLWERSRSIKVRGIPWMESPIVIALLSIVVWPLGLWLLWKHPAWPKNRKVAFTGIWAVLGLIVLVGSVRGRAEQIPNLIGSDMFSTAGKKSEAKIRVEREAVGRSLVTDNPHRQEVDDAESLGITKFDYSKGPNGEPSVTRKGFDKAVKLTTTEKGFVDASGIFHLHGLRITWYQPPEGGVPGVKESESYFIDGKPHGTSNGWFKSGRKQWELSMKSGARHGKNIGYYDNGRLRGVCNYKDGRVHGHEVKWHENGIKSFEGDQENGVEQGTHSAWYSDGKPAYTKVFVNGHLHGEVVEWSEKGESVSTVWKDGTVRYTPGRSPKRAFYYRLKEAATLYNPELTNFWFKDPAGFLEVFGRPQEGSLDFDPQSNDGTIPRTWRYRCSDGVLSVQVVYFILKGDFHVLLHPSATLD